MAKDRESNVSKKKRLSDWLAWGRVKKRERKDKGMVREKARDKERKIERERD